MYSDFSDSNVSSVNLSSVYQGIEDEASVDSKVIEHSRLAQAESKFRQFLRMFRNDADEFPYREQLKAHYDQGDFYLNIDLDDLLAFDDSLMNDFRKSPSKFLPRFELAARQVLASLTVPKPDIEKMERIQIQVLNYPHFTSIRKLSAKNVSKLVAVRGIVISAAVVRTKAVSLTIMCRNCRQEKTLYPGSGFSGAQLPKKCDTPFLPNSGLVKCPPNPYLVLGDSCSYVDQQKARLQENPEFIPTGEMPRHITLSFERYLAGVKPGSSANVVGIYQTWEQNGRRPPSEDSKDVGVRIGYIRVLGYTTVDKSSQSVQQFTPQEIEEIQKMSQVPDVYNSIARSIAPSIYGNDDVKRAIACMLFGGSRKRLPDGMRLRGDINVLLIGDPSVAKSQFLKMAYKIAPVAVYTSGKGSSAAGLTASVIKDAMSGEFRLEGGALVLADGGLACIDEFDKMREQDRVAIHEAMEQQTISIAKAGITTILNSRTSVFAAANPRFGRYDDMKDPIENIDFQTTILSRFDMIFILRDIRNMKKDMQLAKHILCVHRKKPIILQPGENAFSIEKLKKYIAYARQYKHPRLSKEAAEVLKNRYVTMRNIVKATRKEYGKTVIPITVRQLEAVIRMSESLARMELAEQANSDHVKEALRLFQVSTLYAATANFGDGVGTVGFQQDVKAAENYLARRIAIGSRVSYERVKLEMIKKKIAEENAITKAIDVMVSRGTLQFRNMRKVIERTGA